MNFPFSREGKVTPIYNILFSFPSHRGHREKKGWVFTLRPPPPFSLSYDNAFFSKQKTKKKCKNMEVEK